MQSRVALSGWFSCVSSFPGEFLGPGVARVKYSTSRVRVYVNLKIISDVSFEMLWMVEKLLVFSPCGVEYPFSS